MSNREACELYIQQEIKTALESGKKPWTIGKEISNWVQTLFDLEINPKAIESRAKRIKNNGDNKNSKTLDSVFETWLGIESKVVNFIRSSNNYKIFQFSAFNRDVEKIDRLVESMKKHGFLDGYPVHVRLKNGPDGNYYLEVVSGHHRAKAAMKLGISIKFVISEDAFQVWEEAYTTNTWSLPDYLKAHSKLGNSDYAVLEKYFNESKIPLSQSAALLSGRLGTSSVGDIFEFRKGNFKVTNPTHANRVKDFISYCVELGIPFAKNVRFINAVARVLLVDGIDEDRLKSKISSHITFINRQPDVSGYIEMLDYVYNRNVKKCLRKEFYRQAMFGE